jgi:hypothetical protein
MIWNIFLHIGTGIFGANLFYWSKEGIFSCIIIAVLIQGIDIIRVYKYHKNRILTAPENIRENQMRVFTKRAPFFLFQMYLFKVIFYGLVTMFSANIVQIL